MKKDRRIFTSHLANIASDSGDNTVIHFFGRVYRTMKNINKVKLDKCN